MDITDLLQRWQTQNDKSCLDAVIDCVFTELEFRARRVRRGSAVAETHELINAAYLRLQNIEGVEFTDRQQFFSYMSQIMRTVLVDEVRRRGAQKRGEEATATFENLLASKSTPPSVMHLQTALGDLKDMDSSCFEIAVDRIVGDTFSEIATKYQLSTTQVHRQWVFAQSFLADRIVTA